MKKIFFFAAMAAVMFVSCGKGGGTASTDSSAELDSLAYNLGLAQSGGLKQYMTMQLGVDSTYLDDFIRGMKDGANSSDSAKIAYNKGLQVGGDIINMAKGLTMQVYGEDSTHNIGTEQIVAGLVDGLKMAEGAEKQAKLEAANNNFNTSLEKMHDKMLDEKYGDWKKKNQDYLTTNKKAAGVTTLPSGVQYKVIEAGSGSAFGSDSIVWCDYVGKLIDGTEFDSSKKEGREPIQVNLKQPSVIPGWIEVLKIMPKNAVWEVTIPDSLGYGNREMGDIKPYSTLVFTIETKDAAAAKKEAEAKRKAAQKATPTPSPVPVK